MSPPALDRVVKTCLAKDPEDRWQTAGDVGKELRVDRGGLGRRRRRARRPCARRRRQRERLAWTLVAAAASRGAALFCARIARATWSRDPFRAVAPPPGSRASIPTRRLSPDGRRVAFVGEDRGPADADLGPASRTIARERGSSRAPKDARGPLLVARRALDRFLSGRAACGGSTPTAARSRRSARRGARSSARPGAETDGSSSPRSSALRCRRVPASGGTPSPATVLDAARGDAAHLIPTFLPDGAPFRLRRRATSIRRRRRPRSGDLDTKETRPLLRVRFGRDLGAAGLPAVRARGGALRAALRSRAACRSSGSRSRRRNVPSSPTTTSSWRRRGASSPTVSGGTIAGSSGWTGEGTRARHPRPGRGLRRRRGSRRTAAGRGVDPRRDTRTEPRRLGAGRRIGVRVPRHVGAHRRVPPDLVSGRPVAGLRIGPPRLLRPLPAIRRAAGRNRSLKTGSDKVRSGCIGRRRAYPLSAHRRQGPGRPLDGRVWRGRPSRSASRTRRASTRPCRAGRPTDGGSRSFRRIGQPEVYVQPSSPPARSARCPQGRNICRPGGATGARSSSRSGSEADRGRSDPRARDLEIGLPKPLFDLRAAGDARPRPTNTALRRTASGSWSCAAPGRRDPTRSW